MFDRHSISAWRFNWPGFGFVLLAHVCLLAFLWQQRVVQVPQSLAPLFVEFLTPRSEPRPEVPPVREPIKPRTQPRRPSAPPQPQQLTAQPPVHEERMLEAAAPPSPPAETRPVLEEPAPQTPPPAVPKDIGPVKLSGELSVTCSERAAPVYPTQSRRLGEQGAVLLRVELDERGYVASARIEKGSGAARLDDAALAAVRAWRCRPAERDGKPMRAIALQPFNFVLE
jgi:protein TonB